MARNVDVPLTDDLDEWHVDDRPTAGQGRILLRPRSRPPGRTAGAAFLVFALALGTGTLGELPAESPWQVTGGLPPRLHAELVTKVADVADATLPPILVPVDPSMGTVYAPSM